MKNLTLGILASTLFFTACNSEKKEEKSVHNHAEMHSDSSRTKNPMMDAMDKSMLEMMQVKPTGNADYDFVASMKPHHAGAVVMAEELLKTTKNPELVKFANEVIAAQTSEINVFDKFLASANKKADRDSTSFIKANLASMKSMMKEMDGAKLNEDMDHDFIVLMIPHHQSAVDMAKAYLPFAKNAEIKNIAEAIIKSQTKEIDWLKSKL